MTSNGTYAGVTFTKDTAKSIENFIKINKIQKPIHINSLHSTLLYSKKHLPDYDAHGPYLPKMVGTPIKFELFKSDNDNCLVLIYECEELVKRHNFLMVEHKAEYDFDTYIPHITLSYNVGESFDLDKLPLYNDIIELDSEYCSILRF